MRVKHLGEICVGPTLSSGELRKVALALQRDKLLDQQIKLHKLLSGETRYKIAKLLYDLKELCVCDLAAILETTVSAVSHQLKILKDANLVKTRRESQTIYYSLKDKSLEDFLTR